MTLLDLCQLVRRFWKTIALASLACGVAAALVAIALPQRYETSATITVSDPSGSVKPSDMLAVVESLSEAEIASRGFSESDMDVSLMRVGAASQTLKIVVEGSGEEQCINTANSIAQDVTNQAKSIFAEFQRMQDDEFTSFNMPDNPELAIDASIMQGILKLDRTFKFCTFMINESSEAEPLRTGVGMMSLEGLAAGFFFSLLIIAIIDRKKTPIKNRRTLEKVTELPVIDNDFGNRLWVDAQIKSQKSVKSICLVPLRNANALSLANELRDSIECFGEAAAVDPINDSWKTSRATDSEKIAIYPCPPLDDEVVTALCARDSSVTIICAQAWKDSFKELGEALRTLSSANANIAGIALLPEA